MEAFVKRQVFYNQKFFLEKRLPKSGEVLVRVGDVVKPFDVLGFTYVSRLARKVLVPVGARLLVSEGEMVTADQVLAVRPGFIKKQEILAPLAGTVQLKDRELTVLSPPEKFNLVSGIAARVAKVYGKLAVLLEASGTSLKGVWSCGVETVGEIKVLETGGEALKASHLEAQAAGKILVFPGLVSLVVLNKARALGAAGFVCASLELEDKSCPLNVLVTEGFGPAVMPTRLKFFLSTLKIRAALISPARQELIIPDLKIESTTFEPDLPWRRSLNKGDLVQVLNWPHFAQEAEVRQILNDFRFESGINAPTVLVRLIKSGQEVHVPVTNVLLLE